MADDSFRLDPGAGERIASDDVGGRKHQRMKITLGDDGVVEGDVSTARPMPVTFPGGVDTELPAAAALADGEANPTVPRVGAMGMVYDRVFGLWRRASSGGRDVEASENLQGVVPMLVNATGADRQRNNDYAVVLAALAGRTAFASPIQANFNGRGVILGFSASSGTGAATIDILDSSGFLIARWVFAAVMPGGSALLAAGQGLPFADAAGPGGHQHLRPALIPRLWQVSISTPSTWTYSLYAWTVV